MARATDEDLYEVATWQPRSALDRIAVRLHRIGTVSVRVAVVLGGLGLLVAIGGIGALATAEVGLLTALSVVPALALAAYVRRSDATTPEPLTLLGATFLLAVVTAAFAAVVNGLLQPLFGALGLLGSTLFFFLVVGPVEETVKLVAVRLYAYSDDRFDAVIDGAVYGAVAGLGFAFIENALYITREAPVEQAGLGLELLGVGGGITAFRALAGPGHVIYSAIAGYYLGLAKFTPEYRGPIVIKGLILAAVVHGLYNATVGLGAGLIGLVTGLPEIAAFLVYVVVYDGAIGLLLVRRMRAYNAAYRRTDAG